MTSHVSTYNPHISSIPAIWTSPMAFFAEFSQKSGPRVHYAFETIGDELRRSVVLASHCSRSLRWLDSFTPSTVSAAPHISRSGESIGSYNPSNAKNQQIETTVTPLDAWMSVPPTPELYSSVSISQPRASTILDLLEPTRISTDISKLVSSEQERGKGTFVAGAKVVWSKTVCSTVHDNASQTKEGDHRQSENGDYSRRSSSNKMNSNQEDNIGPPVVCMEDVYSLLPKEFPHQPSDIIIGKNIVSGSVIRKEHKGVIDPLILRVFDTIEGAFVIRMVPEVGGVAAFKLTLYDIEARGEQRALLIILTHPSPTELVSRMPVLAPFIIAKIQNIKNRSAQVRYTEATTGSSMDVAQRKINSNKCELRLCLGGSLQNIQRELHDMFEVVLPLTFSHTLAINTTREHISHAHALRQRRMHQYNQKEQIAQCADGNKKVSVKRTTIAVTSCGTALSSTFETLKRAAVDFTSNSTLMEEVCLQRIKSDSYLLPPAVILSVYPRYSSVFHAGKKEMALMGRRTSNTSTQRRTSKTSLIAAENAIHSTNTKTRSAGDTGQFSSQTVHSCTTSKRNMNYDGYKEVIQHIAVAPLSINSAPQLRTYSSNPTVLWESVMPCMVANTRSTSSRKKLEVKKDRLLTCETEKFQRELELAASGKQNLFLKAYGFTINKAHKIHKSHEIRTEETDPNNGSTLSAIDVMPRDDHIGLIITVHVGLATAIHYSKKKIIRSILPHSASEPDGNSFIEKDRKEKDEITDKEITTVNTSTDLDNTGRTCDTEYINQNTIKKEVVVDTEHHTTILTPFICMPNPALCSIYRHTCGNHNRCPRTKCGMFPVKPLKPFAAWMLDSYVLARSMVHEGVNSFRRGMAPLLTTVFTGRQLYITGDNENICAEFAMSLVALLPEKLQKVKYFSDVLVDPYEANIVSFSASFLANCDIVDTADYTQKQQYVLSEVYPRGLVHVHIAESSVKGGVGTIPYIQKVNIADEMYYAKHPEAINPAAVINAEAMRKAKEISKPTQSSYSRNHWRNKLPYNTYIINNNSLERITSSDPSPTGHSTPSNNGQGYGNLHTTMSEYSVLSESINAPFIGNIDKYSSQFSNELKSAKEILDAYDGKVCPSTVLEIIEECISLGSKLEMSCLHDIILYDDYCCVNNVERDNNTVDDGHEYFINTVTSDNNEVTRENNIRKDEAIGSITTPEALNTIYNIHSQQMEIWRTQIGKESTNYTTTSNTYTYPKPFSRRPFVVTSAEGEVCNMIHSDSLPNRNDTNMYKHSIQNLRQKLPPKQIDLLLNCPRPLETPYNNEVQMLQTFIEMILADVVIKGREYIAVYKRNKQRTVNTNRIGKLSITPKEGHINSVLDSRDDEPSSRGFFNKIKSSLLKANSSLDKDERKKPNETDSSPNGINYGNNAVDLACSVCLSADQMNNVEEQLRKQEWLRAISVSTLNIGLIDEDRVPKEVADFSAITDMPDIIALLSTMKMSADRDQGVLMFMGASPSIFH